MGMIGYHVRLAAADVERAHADSGWVIGLFHDPAYADRVLDTDKAWHALQYLLDQHGGAPVDPVFGGAELPGGAPEERVTEFTPDQVRAIAPFLSATPFSELAAHFDPSALLAAGIYPMVWDEPDDDLDYLGDAYAGLVDLFASAEKAGDAVLSWIS